MKMVHHVNITHGMTARLFGNIIPDGKLGICPNTSYGQAIDGNTLNEEMFFTQEARIFLDPIINGIKEKNLENINNEFAHHFSSF